MLKVVAQAVFVCLIRVHDNILLGKQHQLAYSWHNLLKIGLQSMHCVTADFLRSHEIPADTALTPDSPWIIIPAGRRWRWLRDRKQKQGCKASALVRWRKQPQKPLLLSISLNNITNNLNELKLQITTNEIVKGTCILLITEPCLHSLISDMNIELINRKVRWHERTKDSGKSKTTPALPKLRWQPATCAHDC